MGRIRLPPPARRYSPISVIASTPETVSRPNSRSIAERSARSSSKISFPLMAGDVLTRLVASVIGELHINAEIPLLQQGNDFLQCIAILAAYPYQVALDRRIYLFLAVLDGLHNVGLFQWGCPAAW